MGEKTNSKFLGIVIFFVLAVTLFAFQSCKKDRSSANQPVSLGISSEDSSPSWSPDGTRIAFNSGKNEQNSDIYIMNADGSNPIRLTDNPTGDRSPSWSFDGQKIAFVSNRDGNFKIYKMDTDGSDLTRLTNEPANEMRPSWSPDGARIAFDSPLSNVTDHRIVVACERDHWIFHSDWSPDGKYLIFTYGKDGGNMPGSPAPGSNICICDLRTGKWTQVTTDGKHNKEPDWVPVQVR